MITDKELKSLGFKHVGGHLMKGSKDIYEIGTYSKHPITITLHYKENLFELKGTLMDGSGFIKTEGDIETTDIDDLKQLIARFK